MGDDHGIFAGATFFIISTRVVYKLAIYVVGMLMNSLFDHLPGLLSFIGHLLVNIASLTVDPIFAFVIYMAVRIQKENIVQDDLAQEIGTGDIMLVNGVELSDNVNSDNKGPYANILTADEEEMMM